MTTAHQLALVSVSLDQMIQIAVVGNPEEASEQAERDAAVRLRLALCALTPGAVILAELDDDAPADTTGTPGVQHDFSDDDARQTRNAMSRAVAALSPRHPRLEDQLQAEADTRGRIRHLLDHLSPHELLLLALARQTGRTDLLGL